MFDGQAPPVTMHAAVRQAFRHADETVIGPHPLNSPTPPTHPTPSCHPTCQNDHALHPPCGVLHALVVVPHPHPRQRRSPGGQQHGQQVEGSRLRRQGRPAEAGGAPLAGGGCRRRAELAPDGGQPARGEAKGREGQARRAVGCVALFLAGKPRPADLQVQSGSGRAGGSCSPHVRIVLCVVGAVCQLVDRAHIACRQAGRPGHRIHGPLVQTAGGLLCPS